MKDDVFKTMRVHLNAPKPKELPSAALSPVPEFDAHELLPAALKWWIVDSANRNGAPIEFIAVSALVSLSTLVSAKVGFHPKRKDTSWVVHPNLWGAVIGMPSSKKTPGMNAGLRPLRFIEGKVDAAYKERAKEYKRAATSAQARLQVATSMYKALFKKKATGEDVPESEIRHAEELMEEAQEALAAVPVLQQFIVNDATVESLAVAVERSPGILQYRDELTGWFNGLNREDRHNDRSFFLEAYNGNLPYKVLRMTRDDVFVSRNILSVLGGIQRDRIRPLVYATTSGSSENDGLLQRFQMMVYPDFEWREDEDREPHAPSYQKALEVFESFHRLVPQPTPFSLNDDAYDIFTDWRLKLQQRITTDKDMHPAMQGHLGKYVDLVISLAGIFMLVDEQSSVTPENIKRALAWAGFLELHANRVYGLRESADMDGARLLLSRKATVGAEFKVRDIRERGWAGLTTTDAVKDALSVLVEYDQVIEPSERGRPYKWNE